MSKTANKIIIILFVVFLFGLNALNLLASDREFSESENRVLSQLPSFTIKNMLSGRFAKRFETYISDQFVFKDFWVGLKSDAERFSFKHQNNGIFFGADGYLLEDYKKPDEILDKNIESINYFINKVLDIPVHLLLVPSSVKVYEDKLPGFATSYDQLGVIGDVEKQMSEKGSFVEIYEVLESKKEEYIYFKTDHHWTMRGAYYAYKVLCESLGIEPYQESDFSIEKVTDDFYGSYYSKANNHHLSPDAIEVFKPTWDITYEVDYKDEGIQSDTLYEEEYLNRKDKYAMFLDGNHSLLTIKTDINNGRKLVVFKDSYAHCFIPFLANHFQEIHVIDLRYYKLNVYDYIEEQEIDEALFLYSVATFSEDRSIRGLIQ